MKKMILLAAIFMVGTVQAKTVIDMKPYESDALQGCSYTVTRDGAFKSSEYAPYSCGKAMATIKSLYIQFVPEEELVFTQNGVNL